MNTGNKKELDIVLKEDTETLEDKVKDVKKIAISFTIVKNITAKTGNKTLYIRIAKPNNEILSKGDTTFPYEDRQITYSIKKYIEYTGDAGPLRTYLATNRL